MLEPIITQEFKTASGHKLLSITLNSEATLNSLTLPMIRALSAKLTECENDPLTAAIWIQGAGAKAFCAGGDIRRLYEAMKARNGGKPDFYPEEFFESEYRLDYQIHAYPKPIICWGHGIVMGGGMGIFAGARLRLVTESTKLAMPEISIGLYPDVGATWFLSKMPDGLGLFLGLSGSRLNGGDALVASLGTHFIKSQLRDEIFLEIQKQTFTNDDSRNQNILEHILQKFSEQSSSLLPVSKLWTHRELITKLTAFDDFSALINEWKPLLESQDPWLKSAATQLFRGSPTSAKVIFEQLKRAHQLRSLKDTFMRELEMTLHFSRGVDFTEGIRALIIDKDNSPKWMPAKFHEVTADAVEKYFTSPFPEGRENPLNNLSGNL